MDEMSRAQQPPLVPTHLDSDPVHDDDTDDDDDNNTIPSSINCCLKFQFIMLCNYQHVL